MTPIEEPPHPLPGDCIKALAVRLAEVEGR
jgi:hypothetical protein